MTLDLCFHLEIRLGCQSMRTSAECLVKAAEMERLSDGCPLATRATEYEELAAYWRGLARLAADPNESGRAEAILDKWLHAPAIH